MQVAWSLLDPKKWWAAHRMVVVKKTETNWHGDCPWRGKHKKAETMNLASISVGDEPIFHCPDPACAKHDFHALAKKWPDGWCYAQEPVEAEDGEEVSDDDGFEPLGFTTTGLYMYQSVRTGHVVELKAAGHTEVSLYQLVPSGAFWRRYAGGDALSWKRVARQMMLACHEKGYYMHTETRGAGMFLDRGRIVVNLGAHLLVNEKGSDAFTPVHMANFRGDYNYATPRRLVLPEPMGKEELDSILPILELMPWEEKGDALILAGAIVCGHVAGALRWRPHFWLTGEAGGGKSDILNLVAAALQPWPMYFEGATSAAGIRDSIGNSSGLVITDEMEKQGGSSERLSAATTIKRVDAIMEMMRSASSGSRAKVAKGGPDGKGFEVQFKCCALFGSIYYGVEMAQDYRRFCFMKLQAKKNRKKEQKQVYQREIRPLLEKTFTPEFAMRLYSWAVVNSRTILETVDYFKTEMLTFCKDAGEADQWSAVLGSAWALTRYGDAPTSDDVREMFAKCAANMHGMSTEIADAAHSEQVLQALMQSKPVGEHMTIGENIQIARQGGGGAEGAPMWLARHGVVVGSDEVYLCIGHKQLRKIMAAEGYSDYRQAFLSRRGVELRDLEGDGLDFAGFSARRVIVVPLEPLVRRPIGERSVTLADVREYGPADRE